ncbi:transposase [Paenibacillus larvae]
MNIEITDALLVAVIVGLVEVAKRMGLPVRLAPAISVILGIIVGIVYFPGDLKTSIIYGIICGLTSSGLYSTGKNTMQQKSVY